MTVSSRTVVPAGRSRRALCVESPGFRIPLSVLRPPPCVLPLLLTALLFSRTTPLPAAEPQPPDVIRLTTDGRFKQRPAWFPDGQTLTFARHEASSIFLFVRSADGRSERRLTARTDPEFDAVWSPDGKRLAFSFVKTSAGQGDVDVYLVGADGKNMTPFAVTAGKLSHEESPSWSPDGKMIAFSSTRDGNQELYSAPTDGPAGDPRRLTSDAGLDAHPAWSPDGRRIAFATDRWGDLEIALLDVESTSVTRLTNSRGLDDYPAWSPDGTQIAFTSNRDGNFEIYVMSSDGSSPRNVTRHRGIDNFATWHGLGRITFVSNRDGGFDIYDQKIVADSN